MALITCPECGHKVSEAAVACPGCGYPLSLQRSNGLNTKGEEPIQAVVYTEPSCEAPCKKDGDSIGQTHGTSQYESINTTLPIPDPETHIETAAVLTSNEIAGKSPRRKRRGLVLGIVLGAVVIVAAVIAAVYFLVIQPEIERAQHITAVEQLIDAIVQSPSEEQRRESIVAAKLAYEELGEELQPEVSNYEILVSEVANLSLIKKVEGNINIIEGGTNSARHPYAPAQSRERITAAIQSFFALDENLQQRVTNQDTLSKAVDDASEYREETLQSIRERLSNTKNWTVEFDDKGDIVTINLYGGPETTERMGLEGGDRIYWYNERAAWVEDVGKSWAARLASELGSEVIMNIYGSDGYIWATVAADPTY